MLRETGAKEAGVDVELAAQQIKAWSDNFPGCMVGFDNDCSTWSFGFTKYAEGGDEYAAIHSVLPLDCTRCSGSGEAGHWEGHEIVSDGTCPLCGGVGRHYDPSGELTGSRTP
jgi:hypothetical protein